MIIDTLTFVRNINPYVSSLNVNGNQILVGYLGELESFLNTVLMILGRKSATGSVIGSIDKTHEMLDFLSEQNIVSNIEIIKMQEIKEACEKMLKSDVNYLFVIDMASLKK